MPNGWTNEQTDGQTSKCMLAKRKLINFNRLRRPGYEYKYKFSFLFLLFFFLSTKLRKYNKPEVCTTFTIHDETFHIRIFSYSRTEEKNTESPTRANLQHIAKNNNGTKLTREWERERGRE